VLHNVGSPGAQSLVDAWSHAFGEDEVARLVAAVEAAGTTTVRWPVLYMAGTKP
jgi:hypothetical protein